MAYDIPDATIQNLIEDLRAAQHGEKGQVYERYCETIGCSYSTLRKRVRKIQGRAKEAPGRPKKWDRDKIRAVLRVKMKGIESGLGDRELPTDLAKQHCAEAGIEGIEDIPDSTINRIIRELGGRHEPRKKLMQADYANQLHQLDYTRGKYFQVSHYDDDIGEWIVELNGRSQAAEKDGHKYRTWYASLVDDHSRVRIARMFCASGERAELGLTFLGWVWTRPEDGHPLRYPPDFLQTDWGAFRRAKATRRALEAITDADGNQLTRLKGASKDAQGKVENAMKPLFRRFGLDKVVRDGEGTTYRLSDVNQLLMEFCQKEMRKDHPLYLGKSREQVYRESMAGHTPNEIPTSVNLAELGFQEWTPTVDAYGRVRVENVFYQVPEFIGPVRVEKGMKVKVRKSLTGKVIGELKDYPEEGTFELEPFEVPDFEDHATPGTGDTMAETLRKQVDVKAPLHEDLSEYAPDEPLQDANVLDVLSVPEHAHLSSDPVPDEPTDPNLRKPNLSGPLLGENMPDDDPRIDELPANTPDGDALPGETGLSEHEDAAESDPDNIEIVNTDAVEATVDSDFAPDEPADPQPLPEEEARRIIGRRLNQIGQTYADVAHVLDDYVGQMTREEVDTFLEGYLQKHRDKQSQSA